MTVSSRTRSSLRHRLQQLVGGYPWDAVLLASLLVFLIVFLGSFAVDAVWRINWTAMDRPAAAEFRGTCYWMSDARIMVRIAGQGYSDYDVNLRFRHLTQLPDRSWWPVFVWLSHLSLKLTGGHYCAAWIVNLIALPLLPPVIQGITKTRRAMLMAGVALLPFGFWLYAGISEGIFLLFSGVLLWIALRKPSARWRVNAAWGILALAMGIIVGLTKPNTLALLPGFGLLAISRTITYLREQAGHPDGRDGRTWLDLRRAFDDANPGWTALLGTIGMLLGLGLWFYQTSGFYPIYVLMAQRTLWYKEFDGGSPLAFINYIMLGWLHIFQGQGLPNPSPWNMTHFAALNVMAVLLVRDLPPRWPGADRSRRIPLYAAASILTVFGLMYNTGQAHAIERYLVGNIFYVIALLRYVYGDEDEPPLGALPGILRRREAGSLKAGLRLAVFGSGLGLLVMGTIVMVVFGTR